MVEREYPTTLIPDQGVRGGQSLDFALHRRGRLYYQEPTYFLLVWALVLFAATIGCAFIPWEERAPIGLKVKYLIALIPGWGGICSLGFYFVRKQSEQLIKIDPLNATFTIRQHLHDTVVAWTNIIGIQIRGGRRPGHDRFYPQTEYQVNVIYRDSTGVVIRRCLAAHFGKASCTRLAQQYADRFGFPLIDDIETC